jgi:Zn-dependent protease with chaperone function
VSDQNLFAQQESNKRKSAWLVAGFLLFFAWIGFGGDLALYLGTRDNPPEAYRHIIPWIGLVAVGFAAALTATSWKSGAKRVLTATGAWELIEPATDEQKRLRNVVEEMAIASGLPVPRIWIVPDDDRRAPGPSVPADRRDAACPPPRRRRPGRGGRPSPRVACSCRSRTGRAAALARPARRAGRRRAGPTPPGRRDATPSPARRRPPAR